MSSGPSGENPTGTVSFPNVGVAFTDVPITCLAVRTVGGGSEPSHLEATMNLATTFGVIPRQIADLTPLQRPDSLRAELNSSRSPLDCSPLTPANVVGTVVTGDIAIVDAPPVPTTKDATTDRG